jgi:transposase
MLDGVFYVLRTGIQWKALPRQSGAGSSVHDRFQEWQQAGVFRKLWQAGLLAYDCAQGIVWEWQAMDGAMTKAPAIPNVCSFVKVRWRRAGLRLHYSGFGPASLASAIDRGRPNQRLELLKASSALPEATAWPLQQTMSVPSVRSGLLLRAWVRSEARQRRTWAYRRPTCKLHLEFLPGTLNSVLKQAQLSRPKSEQGE